MENNIAQETGILIDYKEMPAYKGAKEKQELLIDKYPFVEITDNTSYQKAKHCRTALRQGRYDLQNGEKTIASRLKDFRELIKNETAKLVGITLSAENKQQAEIERYEAEKKKEKEEALQKERKRKEALRQQVFGFKDSKLAAIASANISTIEGIITDIEKADLQVEEFIEEFTNIKNALLLDAKRKQEQLVEDERLKAERKKIEKKNARQKMMFDLGLKWDGQSFTFQDINFDWTDLILMSDAEFSKVYYDAKTRKAQLDSEIEEEKRQEREKADEEKRNLKAERQNLENEKARLAKKEADRKAKEEAEQKEKHAFMVNQRKERIKALGLEYNEGKKELQYNGRPIWLNLRIDDMDDGTFTHETLPQIKTALENEKKRIELTKSDKQKLAEAFNAFNPSKQFAVDVKNESAKILINDFITAIEQTKSEYVKLIDEL